jgi:ankyrin repeat protein
MHAITKTHGNTDIIHYLVLQGADKSININNDQGITPLAMAVDKESPNLVQLLLSYGARVDAINNPGLREAADKYIKDNHLESFFQTLGLTSNASSNDIDMAADRLLAVSADTALKTYKEEHPDTTIDPEIFVEQHNKKLDKINNAKYELFLTRFRDKQL